MVENDFGQRLRVAAAFRGKTWGQLADHLGVSPQAVHKFYSGKMMPNSSRLMAIAKFFDVSVEYLLAGDDVTGQIDDVLANRPPRKTARQLYEAALKDASQ